MTKYFLPLSASTWQRPRHLASLEGIGSSRKNYQSARLRVCLDMSSASQGKEM